VLQSRKNSLAKKQAQNFKKLNSGLEQLGSLLEEIVRIRSGTDWNLANHWVKIDAAPVAFRIKELLSDMTSVQEELLEIDVEEISSRTHYLIVLLVALFFSVVLISGILGANITRSISEPILEVCKLADELAHGNHKNKRLPVLARNEWGTLSQSFNELLDRLQEEKQQNKG
jgi:nitrogen fixation/metabolism regulation signal transduction histidine kinase